MSEQPWSKFFWSDWEADQGLRLCTLAAQGLWMRMLCVCARHEPKGYLAINGNPLGVDAVARLAGVTETEAGHLMDELEANGVFSRDRNARIYSRRMVRDAKRSAEGRKHKRLGILQAHENKEEIPLPSRGATRGASSQKPEARKPPKPPTGAEPETFAEFWQAYPKREGGNPRKDAVARYASALAKGATHAEIMAGLRGYVAEQSRLGKVGTQYIQMACIWLNKERWRDYQPRSASSAPSAGKPDAFWRPYVSDFVRNRGVGWPLGALSPPPDSPDTKVPPHILAEFGLHSKAA